MSNDIYIYMEREREREREREMLNIYRTRRAQPRKQKKNR
jgi:hypothetical protein